MSQFEQKQNNNELKVETIEGPMGSELSFCSERGGIVTSIKLKGKEILYLDEATLKNPEVNVKGGIPILFPNAGLISEGLDRGNLQNLKQHGFARNEKWNTRVTDASFHEVLTSNQKTKEVYPYNFELMMDVFLNQNNSFSIIQRVKNLEKDKVMPISSGLHPYFKVPSEEKKNIKFNFKGGEIVANQIDKWAEGEAVFIDNPNKPIEVYIPGLGTFMFTASKEYKKFVFWSQKDKDYICIEVFMEDIDGIIKNPTIIKPGQKNIATLNVMLKE
ncbi:MAG: hypothetical protein WC603_00365 [Candidatus Paceibacterota bacterium]|jgi:galactose mutarotase-like enzyme